MSEISEWTRQIVALWEQLPADKRSDFTISFEIIRGFMGLNYLKKHFDPDLPKESFFKISYGTSEKEATKNYRVIDFAEVLINLRDIEGFDQCITRMREADNPESGLAELHIAKMLYVNRWPFKFVKPRGNRGNDYDMEISRNNLTMCADTKCKIETTDLSSKTITSTLENGRTQLPPGGPGVFLVKIPQKWMENPDWEQITVQGARDFFAMGTQRVVSVVFYMESLHYQDGWLGQGHLFKEIINPRHKLGQGTDWRLFEKWKPPPVAPNTMPPFWARLSNFPTGLPGYRALPA
jgi:hypothetical protein